MSKFALDTQIIVKNNRQSILFRIEFLGNIISDPGW